MKLDNENKEHERPFNMSRKLRLSSVEQEKKTEFT